MQIWSRPSIYRQKSTHLVRTTVVCNAAARNAADESTILSAATIFDESRICGRGTRFVFAVSRRILTLRGFDHIGHAAGRRVEVCWDEDWPCT